MMQDEGGRRQQAGRPGRAGGRAMGAPGPQLSPAMENVKATLYSIINDTSLPTGERHRDAVRGLRIMLQSGFAQARENASKLQQAAPGGKSTVQILLPPEYRADKQMFLDSFKVLARWAQGHARPARVHTRAQEFAHWLLLSLPARRGGGNVCLCVRVSACVRACVRVCVCMRAPV